VGREEGSDESLMLTGEGLQIESCGFYCAFHAFWSDIIGVVIGFQGSQLLRSCESSFIFNCIREMWYFAL
jgi:hypothetical protein